MATFDLKAIGVVESSLTDLGCLEALSGTPILDVKPVLSEEVSRR